MRNLLSIALLLLVPVALAGTYKWVDKDGNVHYSDKPVEGAEAVELPEPMVFDAPKVQPRVSTQSEEADEQKPDSAGYADFNFISPKQDQVFWATGGEVPVQLGIKPGLRPGHRVLLYFNGELTKESPMAGLGTTLTNAFRGAHTVRAVVVNAAGDEIATAGPVTFHVKQHSVANPRNRPASKKP